MVVIDLVQGDTCKDDPYGAGSSTCAALVCIGISMAGYLHLLLALSPRQGVVQVLLSVCQAFAGSLSPHQQFSPSDRAMTFLFCSMQTNWQLPGVWNS